LLTCCGLVIGGNYSVTDFVLNRTAATGGDDDDDGDDEICVT